MRIALGLDAGSAPSFAAVVPLSPGARPRVVAASEPENDRVPSIVAAARATIDAVTAREGEAPASVALVYPLAWDSHKVNNLRRELDRAELADVAVLSSAVAVAVALDSRPRAREGRRVTVISVRPNGVAVQALTKVGSRSFRAVGERISAPGVSEVALDAVLLGLVEAKMPGGFPRARDDLAVRSAIEALRDAVHAARPKLVADDSAIVGVRLPGRAAVVQVQREEFQLGATPLVAAALPGILDAIWAAEGDSGAAQEIILTGTAAPTPLLAEMLTAELGIPVVVAGERDSGSFGAALVAAAAPRRAFAPAVAPAVAPDGESAAESDAPAARQRRPLTLLQLWPITAAAAILVAAAGAASTGVLDITPAGSHPTTAATAPASTASDSASDPSRGIADTAAPTVAPVVDAPDAGPPAVPTVPKKKTSGSTGSTGTVTVPAPPVVTPSPSETPTTDPTTTPTPTETPSPTPTPSDPATPTDPPVDPAPPSQ